jgi:hypothetical protein
VVVASGVPLPASLAAQAAQIPPSIEFRVAKPPTVASGDSGSFLTYELHVTNLTPQVMALKRVEVLNDADTNAVLLAVADSALMRVIARPGVNVVPSQRANIGGGSRAQLFLWVPVDKRNPPRAVRHRLTFQRMEGDSAVSTVQGAVTAVDPRAVAIRAPLRGEWLAANGPSNASGHRRTTLALSGALAIGQRFAIDFLQVDSTGRSWRGDSTVNANYFAYGKDIISVSDGVVVETKDSIPENTPRGPVARAVPINLVTVAGNHIVVDMGQGRYAFYAHVQPGTLRVRVGDRVRAGQVLALLGNSGNSTEPHLHFHLVDAVAPGTSTLGAEGIPYALPSFELVGRCSLSAAGIQCTRQTPLTVRDALPLQNELVRFP